MQSLLRGCFKSIPYEVELPLVGGVTWVHPFHADDTRICGEVFVVPEVPGSRTEHGGITLQLIGVTEFLRNHNQVHVFKSIVCPLSEHGEFDGVARFPFILFLDEPLPIETFHGDNVKVRYMLRVTFTNRGGGNILKDHEIVVLKFSNPSPLHNVPATPLEYVNVDNFNAKIEFQNREYNMHEDVNFNLYYRPVDITWRITGGAYVYLVRYEHAHAAAPMNATRKVLCCMFVKTVQDGGIDTTVTIPLTLVKNISPTSWLLDGRPLLEYYVNVVFNTVRGPKRWSMLLLTLYRRAGADA